MDYLHSLLFPAIDVSRATTRNFSPLLFFYVLSPFALFLSTFVSTLHLSSSFRHEFSSFLLRQMLCCTPNMEGGRPFLALTYPFNALPSHTLSLSPAHILSAGFAPESFEIFLFALKDPRSCKFVFPDTQTGVSNHGEKGVFPHCFCQFFANPLISSLNVCDVTFAHTHVFLCRNLPRETSLREVSSLLLPRVFSFLLIPSLAYDEPTAILCTTAPDFLCSRRASL
ncbi:hypothetical protein BDY21DRAFT_19526 [Lineolata rhizophorae]|uniref:Transmembrane protein n=1 Tax=Lineolata rhizophorae TaxID=578093 RepID=A0A6A6P390_9PEZI|nr:hypothetical protein BDY21DRAFT_19526 [Lineolata rhizophorae]